MIPGRADADPHRWRHRFAWWPTRIANRLIWFSSYAFRRLPAPATQAGATLAAIHARRFLAAGLWYVEFWEEFAIRAEGWRPYGARILRRNWYVLPSPMLVIHREWVLTTAAEDIDA